MDSLQGTFLEAVVEDCNTRIVAAIAATVKNNCMVCFNLMFSWFLTFDDVNRFNVTVKVKS